MQSMLATDPGSLQLSCMPTNSFSSSFPLFHENKQIAIRLAIFSIDSFIMFENSSIFTDKILKMNITIC
ncbi:hypothetical protein ACH95_01170 [Bacillus glycinifermentans]|uniref:Uncharacterized protein n=1 Tax=Bacillus glycinifermentans TaxID=1664069 RepID=A0A0J6EED0_9BACI|nr:hypothetical protein COP00_12890 [Bacillus glycinifermentans]KMM63462.1 hypothetical protein ACH95_01170 [Bacillus glycinifermentans]KRT90438.1 hypothetical protein AB447_207620 [Bacillus glycinifermentans]